MGQLLASFLLSIMYIKASIKVIFLYNYEYVHYELI